MSRSPHWCITVRPWLPWETALDNAPNTWLMNSSDEMLLTLGGTPKWWTVNDERLQEEIVLISGHNTQFSGHCLGGGGGYKEQRQEVIFQYLTKHGLTASLKALYFWFSDAVGDVQRFPQPPLNSWHAASEPSLKAFDGCHS